MICVVGLCMAAGDALATDFCVSTSAGLTQALTTASSNNVADEIRLQTGIYRSTQSTGFTANHSGSSLEISGGWSSGCLFRGRGSRSTIDGEYQRTALRLQGNITSVVNVRIAHLSFLRGVESDMAALSVKSSGGGSLDVEIEDNRFHDNTLIAAEETLGGGLSVSGRQVSVFGNVFTENHAGYSGGAGAISCYGTVGAFTNNTVVRNTAAFGQANVRGGIILTGSCLWEVANNILWNNEGYDLRIEDDKARLRNNDLDDIEGTPTAGSSGNINVDPQFFSVGILRLTRSSPLVDAGFNETLLGLPLRSFDGGIRVAGPRIDIGAYELDVLLQTGFDPAFGIGEPAE
ncbi:MAG: hypothetical protein WBP11_10605 [Dokdonella sp.]